MSQETYIKNLKYLRHTQRYSQPMLCKELKISRTLVYHWESGRAFPSTKEMRKLALLFNIPIDDMFRWDLSDPYFMSRAKDNFQFYQKLKVYDTTN